MPADVRVTFVPLILTLRVFIIRLPILCLTDPEWFPGRGRNPGVRGVIFDAF